MGLTENQKCLIQAIAQNDIIKAKKCALACMSEDTTQKNMQYINKYKAILESGMSSMIELPHHLKAILCAEDVGKSFKESRYYLSVREKRLYDNINRMKETSKRLMEMGILYTNSILLYGESGTGKTTFGKYVAYKMGLPFYYLNFSSLVCSLMGETSKNISKVFAFAATNPCVFMLDEIDCISIKRLNAGDSSGSDGEMARITITLMQEFDKLSNDIIIIGATNRKDRIDEALLRRFSIVHKVSVLSKEEKREMVMNYLEDVQIEVPKDKIEKLLKDTESQSNVINELIRCIAQKIQIENRETKTLAAML